MSASRKTLNTLIAGAFALGMTGGAISGAATNAHAAVKGDKEKCYGVVEAGKNMCGDAKGTHSCMGQATEHGSGQEWIALPKGVCDKLVGGSTEPFKGHGYEKAEAKYGEDGKAE